jgi:8-oxo-dGTP pyrophosphatase MutT (NUDIX family)
MSSLSPDNNNWANDGHLESIARGVCIKDGYILLTRAKGADITYLPGGHIEFSESASYALAREMIEEIGVQCEVQRFLGVAEHNFMQKGELHCELNIIFQYDSDVLQPDKPVESCEDWIEFMWVKLENMKKMRLEPAPLIEAIPKWINNNSCGLISTIK